MKPTPVLALLAIAPMLAACPSATVSTPKIVTQIVEVPVAVKCVPPSVGPAQTYADTRDALQAAVGADQRYHLMSSEWPRRDARLALLEGVLGRCR